MGRPANLMEWLVVSHKWYFYLILFYPLQQTALLMKIVVLQDFLTAVSVILDIECI